MSEPLLRLEAISAGYGRARVVDDVSLSIPPGGRLALLGRNGVGKSTLIRSIMGQTTHHGGRLFWNGRDATRDPPAARAGLGIGWVPQERRIFRTLTVRENLEIAARPGDWSLERVFSLLPRLAERQTNMGWQLSGGEQQLLAIGRALMLNPHLLLLDEPLEGLAPVMVELMLETLTEIAAGSGIGFILVEQHATDALAMTEEAIVMDRGIIVARGSSAQFLAEPQRLEELTGVGLGHASAPCQMDAGANAADGRLA